MFLEPYCPEILALAVIHRLPALAALALWEFAVFAQRQPKVFDVPHDSYRTLEPRYTVDDIPLRLAREPEDAYDD